SEVVQFELMWMSRDPRLGALFGGRSSEADGVPVVLELEESEMAACIAHLDQVRLREPMDRSAAHDLGHFLLALDVLGGRSGTSPPATERGMAAPAVVTSALELIERDVTYPWSLGELSTRLYVGPHHLCHLFTRWVGQPPMAFVSRRRAELAALLLVTSDDPIAAIGVAVGWPDPSLFSRAFRRELGVSPRAYRISHGGEPLQTTLVPHRLVHL
ncbi:MAG: helix-turn-helix transcriptional regulator, partial [Chloroflexi bacterium]|nr:helix-turn-helix transcriptional regulator [Chloroflexota bacterium]